MKTTFKYTKVVRKKEERAKLAASACASCYRYYKACGLDDEEIAKVIGQLRRSRPVLGSVRGDDFSNFHTSQLHSCFISKFEPM